MQYIVTFLQFLNAHHGVVLTVAAAGVALFALINLLHDPYRRTNARLKKCTGLMCSYPAKTALYMAALPQEYRRMWRAFVNSGVDKPTLIFEFVPRQKRLLAMWLPIAAGIVTSAYIAVYAIVQRSGIFVAAQVAFWALTALILVLDRVIFRKNTRKAKRIFARFAAQLTANTPKHPSTVAAETVESLTRLNKQPITDETVGKASEILHNRGLSENRTVEEQRRINVALNGLLQSYAKGAQHKST